MGPGRPRKYESPSESSSVYYKKNTSKRNKDRAKNIKLERQKKRQELKNRGIYCGPGQSIINVSRRSGRIYSKKDKLKPPQSSRIVKGLNTKLITAKTDYTILKDEYYGSYKLQGKNLFALLLELYYLFV